MNTDFWQLLHQVLRNQQEKKEMGGSNEGRINFDIKECNLGVVWSF